MPDPSPTNAGQRPREPRVRAPLIIGFCTALMIAFCLVVSAALFHFFAARRPMQSMQPLGIVIAPNLQPLERFSQPGLAIDDDHGQMTALRAQQLATLNSYGWVDRSNGVIRIPIQRAMELVVQRGLPVQTATTTNETPLRFASERTAP